MLMSVNPGEHQKQSSGHIPGEPGVWVMIGGDLVAFSLFFITFFVYRLQDPQVFATSQPALNQYFGVGNTVLMLTSSWFVVNAVNAARREKIRKAVSYLAAAMACGIGFFVVKIFEYTEKVVADITVNTNDFFLLYFTFTGIHLLHVVIGVAVLLFLIFNLRSSSDASAKLRNLESGASFWHLVDLLWIVLLALFYLIR